MNYEQLIVETDEHRVAEITLNRPEHLNTFNSLMAGELYDALVALDARKDVRVILILHFKLPKQPFIRPKTWPTICSLPI